MAGTECAGSKKIPQDGKTIVKRDLCPLSFCSWLDRAIRQWSGRMQRPEQDVEAHAPFREQGVPIELSGPATRDRQSSRGAIAQSPEKLTLGTFLMLLGIAVGSLVLRFHDLEKWGLWVDELSSVQHAAELAAGNITTGNITTRLVAYLPTLVALELSGVDMASVDPKEMWAWRAAGVTEWNMRAHVALLGAVSILILGLLGRRTFGNHATLLLCLLLALSTWHLWMSQASRFYVQLFLLYNLALLLYYQATEDGQLWRVLVAMVCIVLAFYTTPIALMIVGVFAVDIAANWLRDRHMRTRPSFWAAGAAGLAVCIAGILYLLRGGLDFYVDFAGTPQPLSVMTMGTVYLIGAPMVVMAAFGFWAMLGSKHERLAILLLTGALLPLAIFTVFKLAGKDAHLRYVFVALFAWLALAAVGIERVAATMRPRWGTVAAWLPAAALLSGFAVSDYIYMTGGAGYRGQWRQAMAYVQEHRRPGELVGGDLVARRMAMYYLEDPDAILLPRGGFSRSDMRELVPRPAWIVIEVYEPSAGDRTRQVEASGRLQAYFANRIAQPNHTINVYYYTRRDTVDRPAAAAVDSLPATARDTRPRAARKLATIDRRNRAAQSRFRRTAQVPSTRALAREAVRSIDKTQDAVICHMPPPGDGGRSGGDLRPWASILGR